jgi:hypothetical protein
MIRSAVAAAVSINRTAGVVSLTSAWQSTPSLSRGNSAFGRSGGLEIRRSPQPCVLLDPCAAGCRNCFKQVLDGSSGRRCLPELDSAILQDGRLFERLHLTFEPSKFGCSLTVAADEKRGRPEHHYRNPCRNLIVRALLVLGAGDLGRMRRDVL